MLPIVKGAKINSVNARTTNLYFKSNPFERDEQFILYQIFSLAFVAKNFSHRYE